MNKYKITLFFTVFILFTFTLKAQDFSTLTKEAKDLYNKKEYLKSAKTYDKAFTAKEGTAGNYYDAACSWSLAQNKKKAFKYLHLTMDKGWHNKKWLAKDNDLKSLHQNKEWERILVKVQRNLDEYEKDFDKELQKQLEEIYVKDQTLRQLYREAEAKFGRGSEEMEYFWSVINAQDRENEAEISKILDEKGWPGRSLVGGKANTATYLVIQHAPLEMQEKYLLMFKESVKKEESQANHFALLQDRVLKQNNKPQIYGSQVTRDKDSDWYFYEIKDPEYVNQRRKEIGLSPIEEYAKQYGIKWTIEQKEK